jgi:hypothetical protein
MSHKLFHAEIGLPEKVLAGWLGKVYRLQYSKHAMGGILADRYGIPKAMPKTLRLLRSQIFEVEVTAGAVSKFAVRIPAGAECFTGPRSGLDLILVFVPDYDDTLLVKTCWFNESTDSHATLDRSKYECNFAEA